jgi:CSLREA domain-containing protein
MRGLALVFTLAVSIPLMAEPVAGTGGPLIVTRIDDPTPDGCVPGDCSLREAILAANAGPSPDTIVLGARSYTLSIPPDGTPQDGLDGDLDIFQDVTIRGRGVSRTLIDGGNVDRVFNLVAVNNATLRDLTIGDGSVGTDTIGGGAIANVQSDLTLRRVLLTGNDSSDQDGGAVANSGAAALLTIEDSAVVGNAVSSPGGGDGGGHCQLQQRLSQPPERHAKQQPGQPERRGDRELSRRCRPRARDDRRQNRRSGC